MYPVSTLIAILSADRRREAETARLARAIGRGERVERRRWRRVRHAAPASVAANQH